MDATYLFQRIILRALRLHVVVLLTVLLLSTGCTKSTNVTSTAANESKPAAPSITAEDVLQKMIHAYQEADGYGDQAILELSYEIDGERHHDTASIAVRLARPNRARLQIYEADVSCNGQQFVARISDEATNNVDGQWLVHAAPTNVTLKNLLDDPVLYDALTSGLGRLPIQLELLLSDAPLEGFLTGDVKRKLLEPDRVRDDLCFRVSIATAEGEFILWIDQKQYILRRMEFPATFLTARLATDEVPTRVELVADFDAARLTSIPEDEKAFTIAVPSDARQVRYFVKTPQPLPSNLLGRRVADFHFTALDGARWSSDQCADKVVVLHWYVDHPSCEASLRQWEQVRRKYADQPNVVFVAVCAEPSTVREATIREVLRRWDVEAQVVRDLDAVGLEVFNIAALPAIVILNGQQIVQDFELTYNPDLAEQLPTVIDRLLEGRDLATQVLAQVHNETSQYYQTLAAAGAPVNKTPPSARTVPAHWNIEQLWEAPFHQPGNMVTTVQPDGSEHLLILEEGRVVLELDQGFRSAGTHQLPIPESESITHLRVAPDGSSFVAFSFGGRRAYWIDAQWQLIDEVPDIEARHDGIRDACFLRRGEDIFLTVACAGAAGVMNQTRAGKIDWQVNEPQMQTLTMQQTTGQLIGADATGRIVRIGPDGKQYPDDKQDTSIFQVWPIEGLHREDEAALVGISYEADGMRLAYGLDDDRHALWEYRLPADPFRFPVEFVASGRITSNDTAYCVLASADGAIHLLSADGKEHDYFFTGAPISGLHIFNSASGPAVVIGTQNTVTAWRLQPVPSSTVPAATELEDL